MERTLKPGVRARLKSGGPVMTIFRIYCTRAYCSWPKGSMIEGAMFELADLEPVMQMLKFPASSGRSAVKIRNGA